MSSLLSTIFAPLMFIWSSNPSALPGSLLLSLKASLLLPIYGLSTATRGERKSTRSDRSANHCSKYPGPSTTDKVRTGGGNALPIATSTRGERKIRSSGGSLNHPQCIFFLLPLPYCLQKLGCHRHRLLTSLIVRQCFSETKLKA